MISVNRNGLHSSNVSKAYGMRISHGFSAVGLSAEAGRHLDWPIRHGLLATRPGAMLNVMLSAHHRVWEIIGGNEMSDRIGFFEARLATLKIRIGIDQRLVCWLESGLSPLTRMSIFPENKGEQRKVIKTPSPAVMMPVRHGRNTLP